MSYYDIFNKQSSSEERPPYFQSFQKRGEIISELGRRAFDVVVVGGGIHGAMFARLSALSGLKTALFEMEDYAFGTSGRSSKMAHGGLRYLELLDFAQVFEGIRAREDLFEAAGHLVSPHEFFIPVHSFSEKLKFTLGLTLYDLFVRNKKRKHRWVSDEALKDGFIYTDGIMNDSRIVIENILAARQEGALCLNHASVDSYAFRDDDRVEISWSDKKTGDKHELTAGILVNCTGPWVPIMGRLSPSDLGSRVRYSRGAHLLFSSPWKGPARFLPLGGRGKYYFVWPHFAGTLVGTTEHETDSLERDPVPTDDEITELLLRVRRDLRGSELTNGAPHYAFAGMRTLVLRKSGGDVSTLSRRHQWVYKNGVLTLLGGKFTTAAFTVLDGMKQLLKLSHLPRSSITLSGRKLPGYAVYEDGVKEFKESSKVRAIDEVAVKRAIDRLGSRVRFLLEEDRYLEVLPGKILRGEVELAIDVEQAESIDDVMRRLDLEYLSGHGFESLDSFVSILSEMRPGGDYLEQARRYRERLGSLEVRLKQLFAKEG